MKRNITHLQLPEHLRRIANMRAAMLRQTLSEYVAGLVRTDAEISGLLDLVEEQTGEEVRHG